MTRKQEKNENKNQTESDDRNGTLSFLVEHQKSEASENNSGAPPFDVIIVGGGLSGLLVARSMNCSVIKTDNGIERRLRWKLFEANSRIGGRLQNDDRKIDLGGAWIWPPHQPRIMRALVNSPTLDIKTFPQPGEDYDSSTTTRIVGGAVEFAGKIYNELVTRKNEDNYHDDSVGIQMDSPVVAIKRNSDKSISVELTSGEVFRTSHVVLAAPPKILSTKVSFEPKLPPSKTNAMSSSQTWMAGVTKVALVYRGCPEFWPLLVNEGGRLLSPNPGRPAFQVYDGSPLSWSSSSSSSKRHDCNEEGADQNVSVLTFFTLASLSNHTNDDEKLAKDCAEQMCDSLSMDAIQKVPVLAKYIRYFDEFSVKRWPHEEYISDNRNPVTITPHPQPVAELAKSEWEGTLLFAGTETDQSSPGVMEGAVGAALRVTRELTALLSLSLFSPLSE